MPDIANVAVEERHHFPRIAMEGEKHLICFYIVFID